MTIRRHREHRKPTVGSLLLAAVAGIVLFAGVAFIAKRIPVSGAETVGAAPAPSSLGKSTEYSGRARSD